MGHAQTVAPAQPGAQQRRHPRHRGRPQAGRGAVLLSAAALHQLGRFGLMVEIQSFRHAVSILGWRRAQQMAVAAAGHRQLRPERAPRADADRDRARPLHGGDRRRLLRCRERDNLFITGAFSLLHTLLGTRSRPCSKMNAARGRRCWRVSSTAGDFALPAHLAQCCESFDPRRLQAVDLSSDLSCEQVNCAQLVGLSVSPTACARLNLVRCGRRTRLSFRHDRNIVTASRTWADGLESAGFSNRPSHVRRQLQRLRLQPLPDGASTILRMLAAQTPNWAEIALVAARDPP